ncbi:MAG: hypothetical protein M3N53_06025 [Actinomycetota bacterium]|nr:hypothetical protein [Actinomycetota bacterium]
MIKVVPGDEEKDFTVGRRQGCECLTQFVRKLVLIRGIVALWSKCGYARRYPCVASA